MRYLIPPYRLPQEALDKDIQRIEAAGVEFACNQTLGTDFTIPDLFEQGFEAVFVALGTWVSKQMGLEGEASTEGVIGALDFLSLTNRGQVQVPARVAVIGAGSTAMDCVRSAARLGASQASIVYRRTFAEMTADKRELKEAKEEGIDFRLLTLPVRILCTNGKVTGLVCQQMELGEPDASGRPRPVPVDDSEFTLPVDMVVIAVSQQAEMEWNQADQKHDPTNQEHVGHEEPLVLTRWNTLEVDPETMATSWEGVYAAGDIVTGPRTIVEAIAGGKQAAESIITYLEAKHGEALTEALDASLTA